MYLQQDLNEAVIETHIPLNSCLPKKSAGFRVEVSPQKPIPNVVFVPQPKENSFDPNLASWMLNTVIYAYADYETGKALEVPPEVKNPKRLYWYTPFHLGAPIQAGYIGTINDQKDPTVNRILVTIRGTDNLNEWLDSFTYSLTPVNLESNTKIYVHSGFWRTFYHEVDCKTPSLQRQLKTLIPEYLSQTLPNEIYVAGHSLGAAVCTLAGIDISLYWPDAKVILYHFASPRLGNQDFESSVRVGLAKRKSHFLLWRVYNTEDLITNLPFPLMPSATKVNSNSTFPKISFQHTNAYFGSTSKLQDETFFSGFGFSFNLGSLDENHILPNYYHKGIWNGTK